jgi:hypothetical protein
VDADEQAQFIHQYLGPAVERAQLALKILIWNYNGDNAR